MLAVIILKEATLFYQLIIQVPLVCVCVCVCN
jgi:hypothetical protein